MSEITLRFITEEVSENKLWRSDRAEYWSIKALPDSWEKMTLEEKYKFAYEHGEWVKDYGGGYTYPIPENAADFDDRYNDEFMNGNQSHDIHDVEVIDSSCDHGPTVYDSYCDRCGIDSE